ncbi:hypothetical protein DVH24_002210 [Malus domestica]|uniref:Uncharacterized protein n=1 Tax=Malus domestica TaxID=3750 RepID=A0A498I8Z0_MALDO|nr:hypothetical protein DVH24_002210 [Malus domestica]
MRMMQKLKFEGKNDFGIWQLKMRAVLVEQGRLKALRRNDDLLEQALGAILLLLMSNMLRSYGSTFAYDV